jgi:hypothetical protein
MIIELNNNILFEIAYSMQIMALIVRNLEEQAGEDR